MSISYEFFNLYNSNFIFQEYYLYDNEEYYHIYFNDKNKETKKNYLTKEDNVIKIKILLVTE